MVNECPFFLSHLQYPSCHVLWYSKLLSGIMECVLNQRQHAGSWWRHWQNGICGLCPDMGLGTCTLLTCTLPSLLWSVSTSVFCYSRECPVNIHVKCLMPPGIVATEWSSGPYPLLIWVWMLPEEGQWDVLISCPSHLSTLTLAVLDSCSPHKGGLLPSTGLNPFECPSEKCPWRLMPTSLILQLLQGM